MADWTEIVRAHTRVTGRERNRDKVSVAIHFPICAHVTDFTSILFQLTHVIVLELDFDKMVAFKIV